LDPAGADQAECQGEITLNFCGTWLTAAIARLRHRDHNLCPKSDVMFGTMAMR
jgi:hypothetical protein